MYINFGENNTHRLMRYGFVDFNTSVVFLFIKRGNVEFCLKRIDLWRCFEF
jgi:hypothetical protein